MAEWALVVTPHGQERAGALRTVVEGLRARGASVAGVLQERGPGDAMSELVRVAGADRVPAARRSSTPTRESEESFCGFVFDRAAFERAEQWVKEDAPGADVVVIDEVSKLEAAGRGHHAALAWALSIDGPTIVIASVRADQLFAVVERFGLGDARATLELPATGEAIEAFVGALRAR